MTALSAVQRREASDARLHRRHTTGVFSTPDELVRLGWWLSREADGVPLEWLHVLRRSPLFDEDRWIERLGRLWFDGDRSRRTRYRRDPEYLRDADQIMAMLTRPMKLKELRGL